MKNNKIKKYMPALWLVCAGVFLFGKDGYAVCIGEKENYPVNKRAKCFFDGLF